MLARKTRSSRSAQPVSKRKTRKRKTSTQLVSSRPMKTPSRKTSTQLVFSRRPTSQKRIDANRRNARKSTGPRTPAGKKRVSQNAITHGLFSQTSPVLPYENKWEYEALADAMVRDLRPVGILQREIVTQITQLCWKLRRIPAIEEAILETQVGDMHKEFQRRKDEYEIEEDAEFPQPTAAMLIAAQFMMSGDRPFERLEQYQLRLQRSLQSAQRHLEKLREQTAGEEIANEDEAIYAAREMNRFMEENRQIAAEEKQRAEDVQNKPNAEGKSLEGQEKAEGGAALERMGETPMPRKQQENCPRIHTNLHESHSEFIREDS